MQVRERVKKSRSTVCFQWSVAPEGRKVGSLHNTRLHLHGTTLHSMTLHYTTLHYNYSHNYNYNDTTLLYITLHDTTLMTLHDATQL